MPAIIKLNKMTIAAVIGSASGKAAEVKLVEFFRQLSRNVALIVSRKSDVTPMDTHGAMGRDWCIDVQGNDWWCHFVPSVSKSGGIDGPAHYGDEWDMRIDYRYESESRRDLMDALVVVVKFFAM